MGPWGKKTKKRDDDVRTDRWSPRTNGRRWFGQAAKKNCNKINGATAKSVVEQTNCWPVREGGVGYTTSEKRIPGGEHFAECRRKQMPGGICINEAKPKVNVARNDLLRVVGRVAYRMPSLYCYSLGSRPDELWKLIPRYTVLALRRVSLSPFLSPSLHLYFSLLWSFYFSHFVKPSL